MTSTTPPPSGVNHRPLVRQGQSLCVEAANIIGVVLKVHRGLVELAVWPSQKITCRLDEVRHLTSADACPRSFGHRVDDETAAAIAHNRCRPRARDGRCHWCDRELDQVYVPIDPLDVEPDRVEWGPEVKP